MTESSELDVDSSVEEAGTEVGEGELEIGELLSDETAIDWFSIWLLLVVLLAIVASGENDPSLEVAGTVVEGFESSLVEDC